MPGGSHNTRFVTGSRHRIAELLAVLGVSDSHQVQPFRVHKAGLFINSLCVPDMGQGNFNKNCTAQAFGHTSTFVL